MLHPFDRDLPPLMAHQRREALSLISQCATSLHSTATSLLLSHPPSAASARAAAAAEGDRRLRLPSVLSTGGEEGGNLGTARSDDGIMELEFVKFVCQAAADKVSPGCSPGNGQSEQGSKPGVKVYNRQTQLVEAVGSDVTRRTGRRRGHKGGEAEHDAGREHSAAAGGAAAALQLVDAGRIQSVDSRGSSVGEGESSSGDVAASAGNVEGGRRKTDEELVRQRQRLIELQEQLRVR
jgi:hypothetical protein